MHNSQTDSKTCSRKLTKLASDPLCWSCQAVVATIHYIQNTHPYQWNGPSCRIALTFSSHPNITTGNRTRCYWALAKCLWLSHIICSLVMPWCLCVAVCVCVFVYGSGYIAALAAHKHHKYVHIFTKDSDAKRTEREYRRLDRTGGGRYRTMAPPISSNTLSNQCTDIRKHIILLFLRWYVQMVLLCIEFEFAIRAACTVSNLMLEQSNKQG